MNSEACYYILRQSQNLLFCSDENEPKCLVNLKVFWKQRICLIKQFPDTFTFVVKEIPVLIYDISNVRICRCIQNDWHFVWEVGLNASSMLIEDTFPKASQ